MAHWTQRATRSAVAVLALYALTACTAVTPANERPEPIPSETSEAEALDGADLRSAVAALDQAVTLEQMAAVYEALDEAVERECLPHASERERVALETTFQNDISTLYPNAEVSPTVRPDLFTLTYIAVVLEVCVDGETAH